MDRRPAPGLTALIFGLLGLQIGLSELAQLLRFPLERYGALQKNPYPVSVTWVGQLRPIADWLELTDRLRVAAIVVLLLMALYQIAVILQPRFKLIQPQEVNPGRGMQAHLELGLLARISLAMAASFWLLGMLRPLAALSPVEGTRTALLLLLGGIPFWAELLPAIFSPSSPVSPAHTLTAILHAAVVVPALWLLWGPAGPLARERDTSVGEVLRWALPAAFAALPTFLLLRHSPGWIVALAQATTLNDRSGWSRLLTLSVLAPTLGVLAAAALPYLFRPRLLLPRRHAGVLLGALLLGGLGLILPQPVRAALARVDADQPSLPRRLGLEVPQLMRRIVLVLTPDGQATYGVAPDGSGDGMGSRLPCNGQTVTAVEQFLQRRQYRSQLTFAGYFHLKACASLDWLSTRAMELDLEMLRRSPTPEVGEFLREKLLECEITPRHRAILDQVANSAEFRPPRREGAAFLGAAYLRFGDLKRAREYLTQADLSPEELKELLQGEALLTRGVIQGRFTIEGRSPHLLRLGLVRAEQTRSMIGNCRPIQWRAVMAVAYTNARGEFRFDNVPDGTYILVAKGDVIGRKTGTPVVEGHPGVLTLSSRIPTLNTGTLNLRFEGPAVAPRGSSGEVARSGSLPAPLSASRRRRSTVHSGRIPG